MTNRFKHQIAENSSFFQGYIGQSFSQASPKGNFSFKVRKLYEDPAKKGEFNLLKLEKDLTKLINRYVRLRQTEGGNFELVEQDKLRIKAIKLVDSEDEDQGISGEYELYPDSAICTKDGCSQYFAISRGKKCGHDSKTNFDQVTFLAFCDDCGWLLPLHYMTNLEHNCPKCKAQNALLKLRWDSKDDLGTYKLQCIKCGEYTQLYFFPCRHFDATHDELRSGLPQKRFRGVPARAGTVVHPKVISLPEFARPGGGSTRTMSPHAREVTDAFHDLFPDRNETSLYRSEFRVALINDDEFCKSDKVIQICSELGLELQNKNDWKFFDFLNIIEIILTDAFSRIKRVNDASLVKKSYPLDCIAEALNNVKEIEPDERDLQGSYLLLLNRDWGGESSSSSLPHSPPASYPSWLRSYGLSEIQHKPNIRIVQALLGLIEGSTRRDPMLFRPIFTGKSKDPTVFVRDFFTEGILFQLDSDKLVKWIDKNRSCIDPNIEIINERGSEAAYDDLLRNDHCKEAIETLLHTYSHMIIQQSTINTGLDVQSLSEIINAKSRLIFIYSTSSINVGGLESTFHYHLEDWLARIQDLAENCPQDPGCIKDEGGSCNACCYVPEFVCERFNLNLDRSTLIGGGTFVFGYLT